ncbi:MAG: alpha/beta hydrolase [Ignavibacteriae bacterium]|nr:alpha/beta hydrolase [Ignavibacteriota bacterium]
MDFIVYLIIFFASFVVVWLASFLVEALRPAPKTPEAIPWDPSLKPAYVTVDGVKLRYLKVGKGPVLLLLHTLRTQLDLFHKVIPELARDFTVYVLDYPGHGYSDIPDGSYDADFFVKYVDGFLDELDLTGVTLSGVSIGATISLIIAARNNPRVVRIIPINPYDYYKGKGLARASWLGRLFVSLSAIPIVGDTVMRLRSYIIMKAVLSGGVRDPKSISPALMKEMYMVGNRRGHNRGFINLLRNSSSWERTRLEYGNINVPTFIIWGGEDWSLPEERRYDESLIPGVQSVTVEAGGHFLPLDAPNDVVRHIRSAAKGTAGDAHN